MTLSVDESEIKTEINLLSSSPIVKGNNQERPLDGAITWFHWDFDTWEPEHRHWVAPSSLTIYSDYSVRMTAAHLAAMWRWPGPFDDGPAFDFWFEVELFYQDQPFIKLAFNVIRLGYRQKSDNFDVTRSYAHLARYLEKATKARVSRVIAKEPPRDDKIPIPIPTPGDPNDPDWPWGS
ncbi:hypothetical protein [Agrobacterium cavarae]|uniref:hypothetical protein n=1 Tax=Agrobacterium cavarae TaxID=2528239 RepID=UPI003EE73E4D